MEGFELLGTEDRQDLTKLLLDRVSGGLGLQTYRNFLASSLNTNLSHANLAEMDDQTLLKFYVNHPRGTPKYLDLRNQRDLARLEDVLGIRIVISRPSKTSHRGWTKVSDRRIYDRVFGNLGEVNKVFFFALDVLGQDWALYASDCIRTYSPSASEAEFISKAVLVSDCYLCALLLLLDLPPLEHKHSLDLSLTCDSTEARQATGRQVLFATHLGTDTTKRTSFSAAPKKQLFGRLGVLRSKTESLSKGSDVCVVCLTGDGRLYLPHENLASHIRDPGNASKSRNSASQPHPNLDGLKLQRSRKMAAAAAPKGSCPSCKEAPQYAANMSESGPQLQYRAAASTFDLLHMMNLDTEENVAAVLECCRLTSSYFDLESCTYTIESEAGNEDVNFPYLPLSEFNLPRKIRAAQRPVLAGSMDALDLSDGTTPEILRAEKGVKSDSMLREFGRRVLDRRDRAVCAKHGLLQDLFCTLEGLKRGHFEFFASCGYPVTPPPPLQRQQRTSSSSCDDEDDEEPRKKKAKNDVTPERLLEKRNVRKWREVELSWKHSMPGVLETNLTRLANKFLVWSFAGERYDNVLVSSSLITFFKEQGCSNVKMQREGSSVRWLRADNITFVDIRRLLPAGSSLAKFRDMAGLEPDKGIFPWGRLDDSLDFLEAPDLPANAADWRSELTGDGPPQEMVDEARSFFRQSGFTRVSQFLDCYLEKDVLMLAQGTEKLMDAYYKIFKLHPVDCGKLTVSSLSSYASQTYLFRKKAPAMFSVNNTKMYAMLRRGLRGGITLNARNVAGKDCDMSDFVRLFKEQKAWQQQQQQHDGTSAAADRVTTLPTTTDEEIETYLRGINSHLVASSDDLPLLSADYLGYYDVNGLYSYCTGLSLPYGTGVMFSAAEAHDDDDGWEDGGGGGNGSSSSSSSGTNGKEGETNDDADNPYRYKTLKKSAAPLAGSRGDNAMDSQESLFVQYLCLELFPEATRCCSNFTAGPGQQVWGRGYRQRADCLLSTPSVDPDGAKRMTLRYFNYHGGYTHRSGEGFKHRPGCRRSLGPEDEEEEYRDRAEDDLKCKLAAAMTASAASLGLALDFKYRHVHECEIFHSFAAFDPPASVGSLVTQRTKVATAAQPYGGIRQLLRKHHYQDAVFGLKKVRWRQEELVEKILRGGYNSEGNHFGGFLLISGGRTTKSCDTDPVGYCLQRCPTLLSELGDFTKFQAQVMCDGDEEEARALLGRYCKNDQTVLRRSFAASSAECISLDYFRWLCSSQGLVGYKIWHFLFYRHGHFLNGWLEDLQQQRHDLRRTGGSELMQSVIKIILNGTFGFSCMQASSFTSTSVLTETTLASKACKKENIVQLTLVGATTPATGYAELIYAVSRRRPEAPIRNAIQMSSAILSSSKVVFLDILCRLTRLLCPRKAQLCYTDTDSVIYATAFPSLRQCLKSEDDASVAELESLLEDTTSSRHQAGKLKEEGWFTGGLFRSAKSYFLSGKLTVRRMRSVPRRVQETLSAQHFGQDSLSNAPVVRTTCLRPTLGLQVAILDESRKISHSLNFKMMSIDPVHTRPLP